MFPRIASLVITGVLAGSTAARTQGTLIVVNQKAHDVELINPATGALLAPKIPVGINGHEVAISPDGKLAYVPIYSNVGVGKPGSNGQTIDVIDIAAAKLTRTIDLGHPVRPHRAIFGPGGKLYVSAELDKAIDILDPATGALLGQLPTGSVQSHMFAFTPDGSRVYTANVGDKSISVINVKTRKLLTQIPLDARMQRMAVSRDGRWVFSSDWDAPRLAVIDTKTNALSRWIEIAGPSYATEPTPDGKYLLIGETIAPGKGAIEVLDLATMKRIRAFNTAALPNAFITQGNRVYASSPANGNIEILDLSDSNPANYVLLTPIKLSPGVDGLGWSPITPKP